MKEQPKRIEAQVFKGIKERKGSNRNHFLNQIMFFEEYQSETE
jgi:hypothetical protein